MDFDTLQAIFQRPRKPLIFAPLGNGNFIKTTGADPEDTHIMDWWESKRVEIKIPHTPSETSSGEEPSMSTLVLDITCTPSQHFTGRILLDDYHTLWCSWVVEAPSTFPDPSIVPAPVLDAGNDATANDQAEANGEEAGPSEANGEEAGPSEANEEGASPAEANGEEASPAEANEEGTSPEEQLQPNENDTPEIEPEEEEEEEEEDIPRGETVKVYFAGDTGYRAVGIGQDENKVPHCPAFKEIGEVFGGFDFAMIPIGWVPFRFLQP